jgi:hypothetical protein
LARSSSIARDSASRQRLAHPAGVAAHQVGLQLRQLVRRNPHLRELAEAGVDSVNRLPGRQNLFNQRPAFSDASQGGGRNGHWTAGERHSFNFGQRQWLSIKNQAIFGQGIHESDGMRQENSSTDQLRGRILAWLLNSVMLAVYGDGFHGITR